MAFVRYTTCFLVFSAASVAAAVEPDDDFGFLPDGNRSLLSARDIASIAAAKADWSEKCKGSRTKVGKIHTHVYHIYEGGSGYGLQEHNAADVKGDLTFVFPRGFQAYYKGGYIAMLHVGVTQWGRYLRCNHAPGSHTYSCQGGSYPYAGREIVPGGGNWYSFPAVGKDKQWSEIDAKSGPCMMMRISAKCLFNNMAKKNGRCKSGCDGLSYQQCSNCVQGMSTAQMSQVWDDAFWNKKCPRHETEDEELDEEIDNNNATTQSQQDSGNGAVLV